MLGQLLDSAIGVVFPGMAMKRMLARATMKQMASLTGTGGSGGYKAGKLNRLTKGWQPGSTSENAQPRNDIDRMRALSWDLYRNNPHARKICRTLESKVIGRGMRLQSQAQMEDGSPDYDFRTRARELWNSVQSSLDYRGEPGKGGQTLTDLAKTALRAVVLSGETLVRERISPRKGDGSYNNIVIQLIHADRLSAEPARELSSNNYFFYGIETNINDARVAYHLSRFHPNDPRAVGANSVVRIFSKYINHLFIPEDIDQMRGVPWFGSILSKNRDTEDYEYSELKAAAVSACVVLGYRRSSGQTSFGVNQPDDWDLTDADGNKLTAMQPGMMIDLGRTGEIQGFNPMRPNANAPEFISHLLRSQSAGMPGIKSSTLTGDYRNSSFSSEKSADNDTWPEIEGIQDWFASTFYQPIYESVILSGVINGYFSDLLDIEQFKSNRTRYLSASWHGPVSRSINPTDDAKASKMRIQNMQSSPQLEAAMMGRDWQEIARDFDEFIEFCSSLGLPEDVMLQAMGITQKDFPESPEGDGQPSDQTDNQDDQDNQDNQDSTSE